MSELGERRWLPASMSALRAFEAAARLSSFTKAALELSVSQSAVSHGVRELETHLGTKLFVRDGRRLALTDTAKVYLRYVQEGLNRLRAGDVALIDPLRSARVLTVSVSPSFAAKWLVPRLGAFSAEHPDIDLRISANPRHIDFADGEIELAVRHGNGDWPNLRAVQLCKETLYPVCSASVLAGPVPRRPSDLKNRVLIHHRDFEPWRNWLETFGVKWSKDFARGPVLNEMNLVIDAALAGQGIAFARSALVARDIAEGRLVRPMSDSIPASYAYWIVCRTQDASLPKIQRFRNWLLAEAAKDAAASSTKV